jgi:ATP-dependent DNA ligase
MTCDDGIAELVESDQKRRGNRTDQEIRSERAFGLGRFYTNIVENQGQEGIMIKNLNAPYMLGEASRYKGYWRKLKPDYDGSSQSHPINDLDCLVLGGYFVVPNRVRQLMKEAKGFSRLEALARV